VADRSYAASSPTSQLRLGPPASIGAGAGLGWLVDRLLGFFPVPDVRPRFSASSPGSGSSAEVVASRGATTGLRGGDRGRERRGMSVQPGASPAPEKPSSRQLPSRDPGRLAARRHGAFSGAGALTLGAAVAIVGALWLADLVRRFGRREPRRLRITWNIRTTGLLRYGLRRTCHLVGGGDVSGEVPWLLAGTAVVLVGAAGRWPPSATGRRELRKGTRTDGARTLDPLRAPEPPLRDAPRAGLGRPGLLARRG